MSTDALTYREARREDLVALVALLANDPLGSQREQFSTPLHPGYISAFEHIEKDPHNQLLVVTLMEQVVGVLQLTFIPYLTYMGSWRCLIEGVRVHADYRGRGYGEQMLRYAIAVAKAKGCRLVQLTSDKQRPEALHFYERLGFVASHEGFKLKL